MRQAVFGVVVAAVLAVACSKSAPTAPSVLTALPGDGSARVGTQASIDRAPVNANCGDQPVMTQANPQGSSLVFEWRASSQMTHADLRFRKKPNVRGVTDTAPGGWPVKFIRRANLTVVGEGTWDVDNRNNSVFEAGQWAVESFAWCGSFQGTGGWSAPKEFTIAGPQPDAVECQPMPDPMDFEAMNAWLNQLTVACRVALASDNILWGE